MTKGEMRVGINFNPSSNKDVEFIKRRAADLIDFIDALSLSDKENVMSEQSRLKAVAIHEIETAAMYAVKAATKDF